MKGSKVETPRGSKGKMQESWIFAPFFGRKSLASRNINDAFYAKPSSHICTSDFGSSSEDEDDILSRISLRRKFSSTDSTTSEDSSLLSPTSSSYNISSWLKSSDSKIIAPNVGKLSAYSVVEICLRSKEIVSIMCSVDVLKMRSSYFCEILLNQEKKTISNATSHSRDTIIVDECSPFEAAAFLESLHEGRALFKGEWNQCWARLSVQWGIDDINIEYASQIEVHLSKVLGMIRNNHWRTNPNILKGMKIAIFRKNTSNFPTIITGIVVEGTNIPSRVRVAFDVDKSTFTNYNALLSERFDPNSFPSPFKSTSILSPTRAKEFQQVIGDVCEPFWIQSHEEGSPWQEPDELFSKDIKKWITITDRRVFWEMIQSIIELPQLLKNCKVEFSSHTELAALLSRAENKILWSNNSADCLPKSILVEIVNKSHCESLN